MWCRCSPEREDFLIRNNGEKVAISSLDGRKFGLFLSEIHYDRIVTDDLIKVYNQLSSEGRDFEIVFVSCDSCEETFNMYFSDMPWLAVPFADSDTRERLHDHFGSFTEYYPDLLVIYDAAIGMVVNEEGLRAVAKYGVNGYPFTVKRYYELEAAAKKEQSLRSLLVSSSRDYLISNDGSKVAVSDLEGKIVAFYFWFNIPDKDGGPDKLTRVLAEIYRKLKEAGESFEVVLVPLDDNKSSYEQGLASMPWLAIPFEDEGCERLIRYFELWPFHLPTVLVIGADGKIMLKNYDSLIDDYGVLAWEAFPFSEEQLDLLPEKARAAQTLESLLVAGDLDYVIRKEGLKVPVKELVGKTILLFFAMNGSIWCQKFLPMLIEAYHKIKRMDSAFEVIYVPMGDMNTDPGAFEFFLRMPWLAVPVGDERIGSLENTLEVGYVNTMVVIGPTGQTITNNAATSLERYGADAYPFSGERIKEVEMAQTLESLLVAGDLDYVIGKEGLKVPVKELVGKTILLFFSARGSGTCRGFLPHLIEEYHKIKRMDSAFEVVNISMDSAFEVVNISMDKDQDSFEEFFSGMPWLALPFGDERKKSLERTFGGGPMASLVVIGPTGRTRTRYATRSLPAHGAEAYPCSVV
ncbi:Nucleoredoxin [Musa troglodytarum]|uniref:protein-disulfide reductase n=1 Tax=Musa troglodytarum TaxID=320322 RepID=A0A9E7GFW1_9LILI|nr:Nucleoredoxin [Musa troglodytarum]